MDSDTKKALREILTDVAGDIKQKNSMAFSEEIIEESLRFATELEKKLPPEAYRPATETGRAFWKGIFYCVLAGAAIGICCADRERDALPRKMHPVTIALY